MICYSNVLWKEKGGFKNKSFIDPDKGILVINKYVINKYRQDMF